MNKNQEHVKSYHSILLCLSMETSVTAGAGELIDLRKKKKPQKIYSPPSTPASSLNYAFLAPLCPLLVMNSHHTGL